MALARICWLAREEGGRRTPFTGRRYVTVARFAESEADWTMEAWSLVSVFREADPGAQCPLADVEFLVAEAPHHLLHPGSRFELLEGYRVVARGEVLAE